MERENQIVSLLNNIIYSTDLTYVYNYTLIDTAWINKYLSFHCQQTSLSMLHLKLDSFVLVFFFVYTFITQKYSIIAIYDIEPQMCRTNT